MSFNLPPGCSVNDLPGNSDKDFLFDTWVDDNYEMLESKTDAEIDCLFQSFLNSLE